MGNPLKTWGRLGDLGFAAYVAGDVADAVRTKTPSKLIEPAAIVTGGHLGVKYLDTGLNLAAKKLGSKALSSLLGYSAWGTLVGGVLLQGKQLGDEHADAVYKTAKRTLSERHDQKMAESMFDEFEMQSNVREGLKSGSDLGTSTIAAESKFRRERGRAPQIDLDTVTKEWSNGG